jgi:hypothetical protein
MDRHLSDTLQRIGKPAQVVSGAEGSKVLVLPHGGRILGLYSPGSAENFLWTHPALADAASAAAFFAGDQWHNSGGDRTWLAPEVDFFFPNFPRTDVYWQPRQLDPGAWRMEQDGPHVRLVNRLTHRLSRTGIEVALEIAKTVLQTTNPLHHNGAGILPEQVEFAGFTLHTSLMWLGELSGGPVGLWDLTQMPHGGELLVPTYYRSEPRVLFGQIASQDVEVQSFGVRYAMRAAGEHKLAIRAAATAGRIGYVYRTSDGRWVLIVRNVSIDPAGPYVDAPWTDVHDLGYAVQACNINSALGAFSELEYHVPAIGPGTGRLRSDDVSQLWAFRGPAEAIQRIGERLLGTVMARLT